MSVSVLRETGSHTPDLRETPVGKMRMCGIPPFVDSHLHTASSTMLQWRGRGEVSRFFYPEARLKMEAFVPVFCHIVIGEA